MLLNPRKTLRLGGREHGRAIPLGDICSAAKSALSFDHLVGTTSAHLRRVTTTTLDVARSIRATPSLYDHSGEYVGLQHHQNADEAGQCDRVAEAEAQDRVPSCPNQLVAVEATTIDWASIILPMTPPEELAALMRMGEMPSCSEVMCCRFVRAAYQQSVRGALAPRQSARGADVPRRHAHDMILGPLRRSAPARATPRLATNNRRRRIR